MTTSDASDQPIVMRLRKAASGRDVWRVQDKDDKSYCIEFERWEKHEAERWWNDAKDKEWNKNRELVLVRVHTQADRLMQEAADMLEFFLGQLQLTDCKMNSNHGWRFRHGWPMTHCVGATPEDAAREAIREIERSRSESA